MSEPAELLLDAVAVAERLALVELLGREGELLDGALALAGGEQGASGQLARSRSVDAGA